MIACDVGFDGAIFECYLAQLYLRKHRHDIYRTFYAPGIERWPQSTYPSLDPGKEDIKAFEALRAGLSVANWVPQTFRDSPGGAPAAETLGAHLRAAYWGTEAITYRPVIRHILSFSRDAGTTADAVKPLMIDIAYQGVKALVESTRTFHRLGADMFFTANLFGTAHAYVSSLFLLCPRPREGILPLMLAPNCAHAVDNGGTSYC